MIFLRPGFKHNGHLLIVFITEGVAHLAWSNCEIFQECYAKQAPFEDNLRVICRSSLLVSNAFPADPAKEVKC